MFTVEKHISDFSVEPDENFVPQSDYSFNNDEILRGLAERGIEIAPSRDPALSRKLFYASHADGYIAETAVYDRETGALDTLATARNAGIPIKYGATSGHGTAHAQLGGTGSNRGKTPLEMTVRRDIGLKKTVAFGHEVGHYFLDEVLCVKNNGDNPKVQGFCDYFGRAMAFGEQTALRVEQLDRNLTEQRLLKLMLQYQVDPSTLLLQFIEYGNLPPRVAVDSYGWEAPNKDLSGKVGRSFVCLHCEESGGDFDCPIVGQDGALFDFTDRTWHLTLKRCCGDASIEAAAVRSTLTKHYQAQLGQLALFIP